MGKINLTVTAGEKTGEINLETPFQDAEKDQAIVEALQSVGTIKDEGYKAQIEALKKAHQGELSGKSAEIGKLREPIIAGIVADRMRVLKNLKAEDEVAFYKEMSTERLLKEAAHWSDAAPAAPITSEEPASELSTDDDVI